MLTWFYLCVILWPLACSINVTLLHTNDVHARFESYNELSRNCSKSDIARGQCFGGAARRMTAVKKIRATHRNVLLLDGGDQFQGTVWYTLLKWKPVADYVNAMNYTAGAFGNHEFDDGLDGLEPYVRNLTFPIVNSNLEVVKESAKSFENSFKRFHEITLDGQKFGIVGYTTPETPDLSRSGSYLKFNDEIESLKRAVNELQSRGINKIIAIGHSGIVTDRKICQEIPGVDVVVGGHTNTFLYTGRQPPSSEMPEGPYPEVYTTSGNTCLVVQDYAFGKYLGFLQFEIDDSTGSVKSWSGNPILINTSFDEDPAMVRLLKPYKLELEQKQNDVIGIAASALDGRTTKCRLEECNLGNMVTDSLLYHYIQGYLNAYKNNNGLKNWTNVAVAILNGGGIREFQSDAMASLTMGDLYTFMPFANTVELIRVKGQYLWEAFEHSAKDYSTLERHGKFLQVSGVKVVYDLSLPNGRRVKSVLMRCAECPFPVYEPLDREKLYNVVTTSYLKNGGDGYRMLKDNVVKSDSAEILDVDVVLNYVRKFQPIFIGNENRITFANDVSYQVMCNRCSAFIWNYACAIVLSIAFIL